MSIIVVEHLTKRYPTHEAVSDLSFQIAPGEVVGFLGVNGAGKSTTIRMLTGSLPPTSGSIRIGGFDLARSPLKAKLNVGYLPEVPPLYPTLTVEECLRFVAQLRGLAHRAIAAEIDRVLALTDLVKHRRQLTVELSKGFRQRVGLAQALLGSPPLLILDEPTEGLDPTQRSQLLRLLSQLGKDQTVLLSTHILSEVVSTCSRVLMIHQGRLRSDDLLVAHDPNAATALTNRFAELA
jgi:ABC-2 type transport system ATP-binding protein